MNEYLKRFKPKLDFPPSHGKIDSPLRDIKEFDVLFDDCIDGYECLKLIIENLGSETRDEEGTPENIRAYALTRPAPQDFLLKVFESAKRPRVLIIADYTFPPAVINLLSQIYDYVVVCDHHGPENKALLSARKTPSNVLVYYSEEVSGAGVVLQFLRDLKGKKIPVDNGLMYVNALDIGLTGETDEQKSFYNALSSVVGRIFKMTTRKIALETLAAVNSIAPELITGIGSRYVDQDEERAHKALQNPKFIRLEGCEGVPPCWLPVIEGDILNPAGGRRLADAACEEAGKYDSKCFIIGGYKVEPETKKRLLQKSPEEKKRVRHFSLRSNKEGSNAAIIAKRLGNRIVTIGKNGKTRTYKAKGGGGHDGRGACQCETSDEEYLFKRYSREYMLEHPEGPEHEPGVTLTNALDIPNHPPRYTKLIEGLKALIKALTPSRPPAFSPWPPPKVLEPPLNTGP